MPDVSHIATPTLAPIEAATTYPWTVYVGASNTTPALREALTWRGIQDALTEMVLRPAPDKKAMLAIGPYRLRDGATRLAAAVECISLVALDVDCDLPDVESLLCEIRRLRLAAIVHASPSDAGAGAPSRKVRVYLRPSRPMAPNEARAVRMAIARELGVTLDPATGNADRVYFAGVIEGTPPREVWTVDGEDLLVDDLLVGAPPVADDASNAAADPGAEERDLSDRERASLDQFAEILDAYCDKGYRNAISLAVGGVLRNAGLPPCSAEHVLALLPSENPKQRVADALRAWSVPTARGMGALAELLPAEAIAAIEALVLRPEWNRARDERVAARAALKVAAAEAAAVANPYAALGTHRPWSEPEEVFEYLCADLCLAKSKGKISVFAGGPSVGKGPFADYVAVCFALGRKVLGCFPCKQANAVVLDHEGAVLTRRRIRRMCRAIGVDPDELDGRLWVFEASEAKVLSEGFERDLRALVADKNIGVVVSDSYTTAMLGEDIDANKPEYAALAKILAKLDVLVLGVLHNNKAAAEKATPSVTDLAYSGGLGALAQTAVMVTRLDEADHTLLRVSCARAPEERFTPFQIRFAGATGEPLSVSLHMPGAQETPEQRKDREQRELLSKRANSLEDYLRPLTATWQRISDVKPFLKMNSAVWRDAVLEGIRRGSIEKDTSLGKRGHTVRFVPEEHRAQVAGDKADLAASRVRPLVDNAKAAQAFSERSAALREGRAKGLGEMR